MQAVFECEVMSRSSRVAQTVIAIPLGLIGGYLLINMVNGAFGQRLFMKNFLALGLVLFVIGVVAEILIWYYTKGRLYVTRSSDNEIQMEIVFPSGTEELGKGSWACEGIYTKEYEKFGMYKKHLALNLSCNGRPFCLLRHDLAPIASEPEHFSLVGELYNRGGTEYWCKKTLEIFELIRKENSVKN